MSGHTPGPWMAEPIYDGEEGCAVIAVHKDLCLSTPTRGQVAWLTTIAGATFEAPERCEANARLIAAAPELLAELIHLRRCLHPWIESGHRVPGIATLNGPDAAIAKATGETHETPL